MTQVAPLTSTFSNNRTYDVSLFQRASDNQPVPINLSWADLLDLLTKHDQREAKDGAAWSAARFKPETRRASENVETIALAVFDIDHSSHSQIELIAQRLKHEGLRFIMHSTFGHTSQNASVRLVVDLDRAIRAAEWSTFRSNVVDHFQLPADPNTKDPARLYYLPTVQRAQSAWSRHEDGKPLSVDDFLSRPASVEASTTLLNQRTVFDAASEDILEGARSTLREFAPAIEGQGGDNRTFRAAAILMNDFALSYDEAWPILREWNRRCVPMWSDDELQKKLVSGDKNGQARRGFRRAEFSGTTFERAIARAKREANESSSESHRTEYNAPAFRSLADVLKTPRQPTQWLVRDLVVRSAVFAVAAEPKSAKTWVALELASCVATGAPVFGQFSVPSTESVALFMAEDDEGSVKNRVVALLRGKGVDASPSYERLHLRCRSGLRLENVDDLAWMIASVRAITPKPALLILDPLRDIHGSEENDSTQMAKIMATLRKIRDLTGCALCFVHHSAKSGAETDGRRGGQKMRGSSAIHGAVDGGLYLKDLKGDLRTHWINVVDVEVKGARAAERFYLRLNVDDDQNGQANSATWLYSQTPLQMDSGTLDTRKQKVLDAINGLHRLGNVTCSQTEIAHAARIRRAWVRPTLEQLLAAGQVVLEKQRWRICTAMVPGTFPESGNTPTVTVPVSPSLEGKRLAIECTEGHLAEGSTPENTAAVVPITGGAK